VLQKIAFLYDYKVNKKRFLKERLPFVEEVEQKGKAGTHF
jgi:hypothetical protein